jgi:hypothetical protein
MSDRDKRGLAVVGGAVALAVVIVVAVLVKRHHDASLRASCAPIANPYGKPPAGYSFEKADLKTQQEFEQKFNLEAFEQFGLDITLARRASSVRGVLISFRSADRSQIEAIYAATGRAADGGGVRRHHSIGGHAVTAVDGKDGARTSYALEGCTVVVAEGATHADGDALAQAVFKR